jgi:NDP-sugar pyrophosphorylase family protein
VTETITAVVLAGGKGTRIAGLYPGIPKPMIPVAGEPFLHWVTAWLADNGIRDIVYSIGHLAGAIESWSREAAKTWAECRLRTATETVPLGTGGAVRACLGLCGPWVLVANGDSLVTADLAPVWERITAETLDGAIIGVAMPDTRRYGSLDSDQAGLLRGFFEKRPGTGVINAGVYILKRELLARFPADMALSMESDIVPGLLKQGARIGVAVSDQSFLDIGTPESVVLGDEFVRRAFGEKS